MPKYRRSSTPGGTFFFTVVSYHRLPILTTHRARAILRAAWQDVQTRFPFTIEGLCLLPEHIHCIWTLPDGDGNISLRWKEIKWLFTRQYLVEIGQDLEPSASREKREEAAAWQCRFWEHDIRDENAPPFTARE